MRVHVLQHVAFEDLGGIAPWLNARGAEIAVTRFFAGDPPPRSTNADWVIAMGGPMSVNDEEAFPWLRAEKEFIRRAIQDDKVVLGICLGAQIIASSMGATVYASAEREIGWHPVQAVRDGHPHSIGRALPSEFEAFHWHGETFDLPAGATPLARSPACENQAFVLGSKVVGLQFHLETTPLAAASLCDHCPEDLRPGRWVQTRGEILGDRERFVRLHAVMQDLLHIIWSTS